MSSLEFENFIKMCLLTRPFLYLALLEETKSIEGSIAVHQLFRHAATAAERGMGGTSGAIYAIFLNALANSLSRRAAEDSWAAVVPAALSDALNELFKYTLARKGHRTLMDALIPFVEALQGASSSFEEAIEQAILGAESTRRMEAAMGRASYVSKDVFEKEGGVPDPGALGVVSVLKGISAGLNGSS